MTLDVTLDVTLSSVKRVPPVAMSTALMAAEGEAFPMTQYRRIKAYILHSMESRVSAIKPKAEVA